MSLYSDFIDFLATPTCLRKTGYETLSTVDFLIRCGSWSPFSQRRMRLLLSAPWSYLFSKEIIESPAMDSFWNGIHKKTRGKHLYELGVGQNEKIHRKLCPELLGVSGYTGIDSLSLGNKNIIELDVLSWAVQAANNSGSILAFGLFNEPLSPMNAFTSDCILQSGYLFPAFSPDFPFRSQFEHEYLRRLAKELYRIVPNGGILFGDGIRPLRYYNYFLVYLDQAGFKPDKELIESLETFLASSEGFPYIDKVRDPFFFTK